MDDSRYAEIKRLFIEIESLAPEARLEPLAALPEDLRAEVQAMLDANAALDDAFMAPVANMQEIMGHDPQIGTQIGAFRLERLLGEGGMGRVYAASRADGAFDQQVALKLVKRGMDTAAVLKRFEAERRILARLRHPGIARLVGGGETTDGRPYVAMELVDGEKLTAYADRFALGIDARVRLMLQVSEAVAHAHRHLIVHRDLKPSNILVESDASGRPTVKLLDFGIARLLEGDADEALTATGQRPMTRPYAAPEQVRGGEITTATDVWALGVLLYQLLSGTKPFTSSDQKGLETAILETPPTLPSAAVSRREPSTTGTAPSDARRLRGDLDAVCLTALAKEPERRYPNADALAADLRRYLDKLPVEARPPAPGYRIRKFIARHKGTVGVATFALLVLLAGTVFYTASLKSERDRAEAALDEAEKAASFLETVFVSADPFMSSRRDTLRLADLLDVAGERVGATLGDSPQLQGRLYTALGASYVGQGRFDEADSLFTLAHPLFGDAWTQARASALREHAHLIVQAYPDRMEEAADYYRQIAAFYDREYGPDHHGTSGTLTSLAMALFRMGEIGEADSTFRESLRRYAARDTLDTTAYAVSLSQHALLLNEKGNSQEALSELSESLRLVEAQLGPTHPRVAVKHYHLGQAYYDAGRYDEAWASYGRSYAIDAAELDPDHPNALDAIRKQGKVRVAQGRTEEGVRLLRQALGRLEATRAPDFPLIPPYRMDLADALLAAGNVSEARTLATRARADLAAARGDDNVRVAAADALLGEIDLASGDARAAARRLTSAVRMMEAEYTPARPDLVRAQEAYGRALVAAGRPREAVAPFRAALLALEARLGADHPKATALRQRLARLNA